MKKGVIKTLLKLRQYQLEREQWRLYQKRIEENAALQDVEKTSWALQHGYDLGVRVQTPDFAGKAQRYVKEAAAAHELCLRKLGLAQKATMDQVSQTIVCQRRKEMMEKLYEHATTQEHAEWDQAERKLLDDVAQSLRVEQQGRLA